MNVDSTNERFSDLHKNNRVLRLAVVALLLANLVTGYGLATHKEIVTINPPNAMTKATYSADSAGDGALSSWGLYVAELIGNVTPSNADFVANTIGYLAAPSIYKEIMAGISDQTAKIKTDQLTLQFDPAEVKFDATKQAVYVDGWLTTTDSHGSTHREELTYEIYFRVVNYQPRVIGLTSYAGKPHFGN